MRRRGFLAGAAALAVVPGRARASAVSLAQDFLDAQTAFGVSWALRLRDGTLRTGAVGKADPRTGEALTPAHRMRLASISKPVTAAMVLTLVAEGKLAVADRVLGPEALLGPDFWPADAVPWADRLRRVTVDHLLTHTAGGWTNGVFDPAFWNLSLGMEEMIRRTLRYLPLVVEPGHAFGYSNFGYCLLGRVIERVTGMAYGEAVRKRILRPAHVGSFALMRPAAQGRLPMEVAYAADGDAYDLNAGRMDSFAGWVATPADLVRLFAAIDGTGHASDGSGMDVVPDAVPGQMAEPWAPGAVYGRGLGLDPLLGYRGHYGFLPGISAVALMFGDGVCMAAMTNGSSIETASALEALLWSIYAGGGR